MLKERKEQEVEEIRRIFSVAGSVVLASYQGITVSELSRLRSMMYNEGARVKVVKNTLAKIAMHGNQSEVMSVLVKGAVAIGYAEGDPLSAPRILCKFAKDSKYINILGGFYDGKLLTPESVKELADMPSIDVLRAGILGVISAPATKLAVVLQEPARRLAALTGEYAKQ